jgi:2-methylcitrate dehydratase PrpD
MGRASNAVLASSLSSTLTAHTYKIAVAAVSAGCPAKPVTYERILKNIQSARVVDACRAQVTEFGGTNPSTLIGGGQANPIYAAFWHTALVRYVDFMDNFLAPTETCHTADNFGVALTIADYVGGSGRDLMLAVALGYTVQSRFVDHANFMSSGFDHTAQLAFSHNAAAGLLLGLSEQQIANAIAMAAVRHEHRTVRNHARLVITRVMQQIWYAPWAPKRLVYDSASYPN